MTLKEMFKKVSTYNEIAELMGTEKAKVRFVDGPIYWSDRDFTDYGKFSKFIKTEYNDDVAELVIGCKEWDFDKKVTLTWEDYFGRIYDLEFEADLIC